MTREREYFIMNVNIPKKSLSWFYTFESTVAGEFS